MILESFFWKIHKVILSNSKNGKKSLSYVNSYQSLKFLFLCDYYTLMLLPKESCIAFFFFKLPETSTHALNKIKLCLRYTRIFSDYTMFSSKKMTRCVSIIVDFFSLVNKLFLIKWINFFFHWIARSTDVEIFFFP